MNLFNGKNVLISTRSFGVYDKTPISILQKNGFEIKFNPYGKILNEDELINLIEDVDGLIAGTEDLNSKVLKSAKNLKVISRCGVGLDNIDLNTAHELGIKVLNTPTSVIQAVAELTLSLILSLLRRITQSDRNIRQGIWKPIMGCLLQDKKVGIIGLGRIGKQLVKLLTPFSPQILAFDINPDHIFCASNNIRLVPKEELLISSDIISLHIPYSPEVNYFIDTHDFELMKTSSIFVNTSRGGLVNEKALYSHLKGNKESYAGIDTFEKEPYSGPLIELENIILTSHIGSYARESRIQMEIEAAENLVNNLG